MNTSYWEKIERVYVILIECVLAIGVIGGLISVVILLKPEMTVIRSLGFTLLGIATYSFDLLAIYGAAKAIQYIWNKGNDKDK